MAVTIGMGALSGLPCTDGASEWCEGCISLKASLVIRACRLSCNFLAACH